MYLVGLQQETECYGCVVHAYVLMNSHAYGHKYI